MGGVCTQHLVGLISLFRPDLMQWLGLRANDNSTGNRTPREIASLLIHVYRIAAADRPARRG